MAEIILANGGIGTPCVERNGFLTPFHPRGLFLFSKPIFGVELKKAKNNRDSSFRLRYCEAINVLLKREPDSRPLSGKTLEKELEFKPSFDEYLKAMESVKTSRDKKLSYDSNNRTATDSVVEERAGRKSYGREGEENGKGVKIDHRLNQEKGLKIVEQPEFLEGVGGIPGRKGLENERYRGRDKWISESKNEFDDREVWRDRKENRRKREETMRGKHLIYESSRVRSKSKDSNLANYRTMRRREVGFDRNSFETPRKSWDDNASRDYRSTTRTVGGREMSRNRDEAQSSWNMKNYNQLEKVERNNIRGKYEDTREKDLMFERVAFKNFDESNDVMDKPRVSKMEMEERIQSLAKRLNGADIDICEWVFAKMMRSAQIKYTDHTILRLIQIMGKLGNWRRVLQIIEWLQMGERFKSHRIKFVYTTALDVLGKARKPVEALNIFNAMQQQFSSYPDLVAYHSIAVTLGQAGHMRELFDVIDTMRSPPKKKFKTGALEKWDPRLEPDTVVYNAVLNACVQRKQWEGAFWVLQQVKERSLKPSATTYGLVMEVMLACEKYNLVHEFFSKVQRSSIPNALTYKVLVNTLWKEGKTDEAVLAVQEMERRGIVGSAGLYYDLARCLCAAGRCQEALVQVEKICKVASKPLVVTYTGLIQACMESGNVESGTFIFDQMSNFCSPNLVTFNIMLKGYLDHKVFEEAKELFEKMSADGDCIDRMADSKAHVTPDIYSFNAMLDATYAEKNWDDFEYVFRRMLHHDFHFNSKRHLRMILDASRAGKEDLLVFTWKHLEKADRNPPTPFVQELFCTKLAKGDHLAAISCVNNYQADDPHSFSYLAWLKLFRENGSRFRDETLARLVIELNGVIARSDSPNHVLGNLLSSCKDFCRTCCNMNQN